LLKDVSGDKTLATVPVQSASQVKEWRDGYFWTADFDSFEKEGKYYLDCSSSQLLL